MQEVLARANTDERKRNSTTTKDYELPTLPMKLE